MQDQFDRLMFGVTPVKRIKRRMDATNAFGVQTPTYAPYNETATVGPTEYSQAERHFVYENIVDLMSISIGYLQSYHKKFGDTEFDDPWQVWFPFQAWELKVGNRIKNVTTGGVYTVKDVNNKFYGVYKLEGGGQAPGEHDILLLGEADSVQFRIGYPNTEDTNTYFTDQALVDAQAEPWIDTVTYRFMEVEPAGVKNYHSGPTRDLRPRMMGEVALTDGTIATQTVQRFDVRLQFDCWGKTNEQAQSLARWLRECMGWLIPVMRGNGLEHGHFIGQREDIHLTRWRNDIVARSLLYDFRVQENRLVIPDLLKAFTYNLTVSASGEIGSTEIGASITMNP